MVDRVNPAETWGKGRGDVGTKQRKSRRCKTRKEAVVCGYISFFFTSSRCANQWLWAYTPPMCTTERPTIPNNVNIDIFRCLHVLTVQTQDLLNEVSSNIIPGVVTMFIPFRHNHATHINIGTVYRFIFNLYDHSKNGVFWFTDKLLCPNPHVLGQICRIFCQWIYIMDMIFMGVRLFNNTA